MRGSLASGEVLLAVFRGVDGDPAVHLRFWLVSMSDSGSGLVGRDAAPCMVPAALSAAAVVASITAGKSVSTDVSWTWKAWQSACLQGRTAVGLVSSGNLAVDAR